MSVEHFALKDKRVSTRRCSELILVLSWLLVGMNRSHLCAEDSPQYRFQRKIETGELERDELIAVPLDTPVYLNTQDSLNDLRIENADGTTVPFIVRRKRETETYDAEKTWRADDISLKLIKETGLEIRFDLNADDPIPDGLRIVTPLRNFEQRVTLFAIDATGKETLIVEDEVIFDYSQFMDVRNVEVKIPETDARSFRIDIDALTTRQQSQLTELTRQLTGGEEVSQRLRTAIIDRPFRIDRIELWADYKESHTKVIDDFPYDLVSVNSFVNSETNETIINIKSKSQPLTQFEIVTPEQNFQRSVKLYEMTTEGVEETLQLIAETSLVHLDFRDLQKSELTIHFPENRHSQYRLVIDNSDNPALAVNEVLAAGHVDEVIFLAKKTTEYAFQYGNPHLNKPSLDTVTIRTLLDEHVELIAASLSNDETIVTEVIGPPTTLKDALNNAYLIGCIVLMMITVLIWLLYSAAQKVDQLPDDQTGH